MGQSKELTDKQQTFARLIVSGMSQKEAYRQAYEPTTLSENTIVQNASKEARKPHVMAYIERIKAEQDKFNACVANRDTQYMITLIWQQIDKCLLNDDNAAIARYMEILNKMHGNYVNVTKDITDKTDTLSTLSTDDLKAILRQGEASDTLIQ